VQHDDCEAFELLQARQQLPFSHCFPFASAYANSFTAPKQGAVPFPNNGSFSCPHRVTHGHSRPYFWYPIPNNAADFASGASTNEVSNL